MERPPKPPPQSIPAPWAPYAQRPLPARIQGLLGRAALAQAPGQDEEEEEERRVERRVVGLTLETELRTMASRVGAGLTLHAAEAAVCARLLETAGEQGRAARLLWDAGLREDAARLAEAAGEIELLQRALEQLHGPEERSHRAALAFSAYEAAVSNGRLTDALAALGLALEARPDNPSYVPLRESLLARRPAPGRLVLEDGSGLARVVAQSPAWLGRGEDVAVRLAVPGLSRRHLQIHAGPPAPRVMDAKGRTVWTGDGLHSVDAGAVSVAVQRCGDGVLVVVEGAPCRALVLGVGGTADLGPLGFHGALSLLAWPQDGFPLVQWAAAAALFNGEPLARGAREWAVGDVLEVGGQTLRVG
jgi:hypothetical protein